MKAKSIIRGVVALAMVGAMGALWACSPAQTATSGTGDGGDWDAVVAANPDDPYVASYESDDPACLITMHKNLGNTCESCHDDAVMKEVGNFDELMPPSENTLATREFCLNDGCHSWEKIKDSTILEGESTIYNPEAMYNVHDNHRGEEDCGTCHSMHGQPELQCVQCHYLEMPEGWIGFE